MKKKHGNSPNNQLTHTISHQTQQHSISTTFLIKYIGKYFFFSKNYSECNMITYMEFHKLLSRF